MSEIVRPATAFASTSRRTKSPRVKTPRHLDFIRSLPCLITGATVAVEAAHIRYGAIRYGKPEGAMAMKPSDCWTVPLCRMAHRDQHSMNERKFWQGVNINPLVVASLLWLHSGDHDSAAAVIAYARQGGFPWTT